MSRSLPFALLACMLPLLVIQAGCGGSKSSTPVATGTFTITVSPTTASVTVGGSRLFTAEARDKAGNVISGVNFSWQSSNATVAVSLGNGLFRGNAPGSASITASAFLSSPGQGAPQTVTSTPATLSVVTAVEGTAARGMALAGASVSLRDRNGQYAAATSDAQGHFLVPVDGLSGPFLLKVESPDGRHFYGWAAGPGQANLDPYTDLLVRSWYQKNGDADAAFMARGPLPDSHGMHLLEHGLRTLLSGELAARGLDPVQFDLLAAPFTPDHSGFDDLLDTSRVGPGRIELAGWSVVLHADASGQPRWEADPAGTAVLR